MTSRFAIVAVLALAGCLILFASHASANTLTVNGGSSLTVQANDGVIGFQSHAVIPTSPPYANADSKNSGVASSSATYALTNNLFDVTTTHSRPGALDASGQSFGTLNFTLDANATYTASGTYGATDIGATSGEVFLREILFDLTTSTTLFESRQISRNTPNEFFTLGGAGGDASNDIQTGSLTGNLIAGHNYQLFYNAFIEAFPDTDNGATANGNLQFQITYAPSAVPLPTTASAGLALMALTGGFVSLRKLRVGAA